MMPSRRIFEDNAQEYDRWFDSNRTVYEAQLQMLKYSIPAEGPGLDIGVGSGRFAAPLGIGYGIDPCRGLLAMAKNRGIEVAESVGELLPYRTGTFRIVLMMTVLCFLSDPPFVFHEAGRVLAGGGTLIVGFIERDGEIAGKYRHEEVKGRFLRFARFRTINEVLGYYKEARFSDVTIRQRARGFCVMSGTSRGMNEATVSV